MKKPRSGWSLLAGAVLLLSGAFFPFHATADDIDPRRVAVGVKVFSSLLSADQDLQEKAADGRLLLLVVGESGESGRDVTERVKSIDQVRGIPADSRFVTPDALARWKGTAPAGIFVADWLSDLAPVLAYAEAHHSVVFSPLFDDLKRGAHAGLLVSDRILPVVNEPALKAAGIRLRPFFLDVAKRYGTETARP